MKCKVARVPNVSQAVHGILFQTPSQKAAGALGNVIPLGLTSQDGGQHLGGIGTLEESPAGQQFVQHYAEGPNVGTLVCGLTLRLFGCHVRGQEGPFREFCTLSASA
jgi:hypothetical protein